MAQHYKDLIAWQKAMDLVVEIYATTEQFPSRAKFSLTDQIRRAAVSVPSNIAEGQAHYSHREFLHFLSHSPVPLAELETQILIAHRVKYIQAAEAEAVLTRHHDLARSLR